MVHPVKIKPVQSAVQDKAPTTSEVAQGELAVNVHASSLAIYTLDASGAVAVLADGNRQANIATTNAATAQATADLAVTAVTGTAPIVSTGGLTPALSITAATTSAAGTMSSADKVILDAVSTTYVALAGSTMTGALTLSGDPTLAMHAATKQFVDANDFWTRTGTILSPETAGDGVSIGGALVVTDDLTVNTDALFVDASAKKVGIGGSPTYMLDVQGTDAALRLKGTASTGFIADQDSNGLVSLINYDSGADLRFGTAGAEAMRLDSSGSLLIGGTLPSSPNITLTGSTGDATFNTVLATGGVGSGVQPLFKGTSDSGGAVQVAVIRNDGSAVFSGTVDIGTTSSAAQIQFPAATGWGPMIKQSASSINALGFFTDNTERLTIDNAGAATFGGTIQSGGNPNDGLEAGTKITSTGVVQATRADGSGSSKVWMGYLQDGNNPHLAVNPTSTITAAGAATFAGYITSNQGYYTSLGSAGTGSTSLFKAWHSSSTYVDILDNGAATFAADATISGLTVGKGLAGVASNTAVGNQALNTNTTGAENTAIGLNALYANTTGNDNVASGHSSLRSNTTGNYNTACGQAALYSSTTGSNNTASGYYALCLNTTGESNTASGWKSLYANTTGNFNTAHGIWSLHSNTTGSNNTASGRSSLYSNTTGSFNTASGYYALYSNTTGNHNIASGYFALYSNTIASYNAAVGYESMYYNTTGQANTAVGTQALLNNKTASYNTAVGYQCLGISNQCTGSYNTAIGTYALHANSSGNQNTVSGYEAMLYNTTGAYNVANGMYTLRSNTTGTYNVANGMYTLYYNETGSTNTANGYSALYRNITSGNTATGYQALYNTYDGTSNTADGVNALYGNTSGEKNTAIGHSSGDTMQTGNFNTMIGYNAQATTSSTSGEMTLGDANISNLRCNDTTISGLSDGRDKTDVIPSPLGVDFLNTLNPVKYKWETRDGNVKDGTYEIGFIAQELQTVLKDSNTEYLKMVCDANPDRLEASYAQLVPILVQAIKELSAQVKELQNA